MATKATTAVLVNAKTGRVANMIVADPDKDPAPPGFILCHVPPGYFDATYEWDGQQFVAPKLFAVVDDNSGKVVRILSVPQSDLAPVSDRSGASVVAIGAATVDVGYDYAAGVFTAPVVVDAGPVLTVDGQVITDR